MATNTDLEANYPVFIHSLFRSGSTYLFHVFRRSECGYWCYQEPLHEAVLGASDEPQKLLHDRGNDLIKELRHPSLDAEYFWELFDIWPAWKWELADSAVYDGYFAPPGGNIGTPFVQTLIRVAKGRPVIQECRTAGRIAALKAEIGGFHIYLWRNPWDQWWSYKVAHYFDIVNLLIINALNAPTPVRLLRDALHIEDWTHNSVGEGFAHYWNKALTAEDSYLIFYLLWCLGMHEGVRHGSIMLNIDRLSDSADYQSEIQARLKDSGIDGVDFADCRVPQGRYLEKDVAFFCALEVRVHHWLKEGGWTQQDIDQIQALRQQYLPFSWSVQVDNVRPSDLAEQASRARALACRFETSWASAEAKAQQAEAKAQQAEAKAQEAEAKAQEAEAKAQEAEAKAQEAEAKAQRAEAKAQQSEAKAQQAEARTQQSEAKAQQAESAATQVMTQIQAVYASRSWRITAPLRKLGFMLKEGR